jgi:hypothetical protein
VFCHNPILCVVNSGGVFSWFHIVCRELRCSYENRSFHMELGRLSYENRSFGFPGKSWKIKEIAGKSVVCHMKIGRLS